MLPDSLLAAFKWIEQSHGWMFDFGHLWGVWWLDIATASQRQEILDLAKSESLARNLRQWAKSRWPEHPFADEWLVSQLSREEPFSRLPSWTSMIDQYRLTDDSGIFGVAVPDDASGSREHVWQLNVHFLPASGREAFSRKTVNFTPIDREANAAPEHTVHALETALNRLTRRPFLAWFLHTGWKDKVLAKWTVAMSFTLTVMLLALLQMLPDAYLRSDELPHLWTLLFVVTSLALILSLLTHLINNWRKAMDDRGRWLDLLDKSAVVISISGSDDANRLIRGASYSLTFAVSMLLALNRSRPAHSVFFQHVMNQFAARRQWLYTGALSDNGVIEPVTHLNEKYEAATRHQDISVFVYSAAGPQLDHVSSSIDATLPEYIDATSKSEYKQPRQVNAAFPVVTHAGSRAEAPRQLRFENLVELLFAAPSLPQCAPAGLLLVWCLVVLSLSFVATRDAYRLSARVQIPRMSMAMQASTSGTQAKAFLTICSKEAHRFGARLTSDTWQSLPPIWFPRGSPLNDSTTIPMTLTKAVEVRTDFGIFDGKVELLRDRSMLWRRLPPVEKVSIGTILDLVSESTVRCSEEEL
jgi:hypothetical protein